MESDKHATECQPAQVGATFRIVHPLVNASSQSLGSHEAQVDKTAAFRSFGEAAVNCTFSKIEWGYLENQKACMVCLDVSISWNKSYVLEYARLDLIVQNEGPQGNEQSVTSAPLPRFSRTYGPKDPPLEGPRVSVERSSEKNLHAQIPTPIGQIDTPSRTTKESWVDERLWKIIVATEPAPKDREQRVLRCRMVGNIRTQVTFPDAFRLGLIVEHHGNPFVIRFALSGSVVGLANAAVLVRDAFTFGGSRKLSKLDYSFKPEDSSKAFTSAEFAEHLNEINGRLQVT